MMHLAGKDAIFTYRDIQRDILFHFPFDTPPLKILTSSRKAKTPLRGFYGNLRFGGLTYHLLAMSSTQGLCQFQSIRFHFLVNG